MKNDKDQRRSSNEAPEFRSVRQRDGRSRQRGEMHNKTRYVNKSVKSKSMIYAALGIVLCYIITGEVFSAVLTGLILYLIGMKLISPDANEAPRSQETSRGPNIQQFNEPKEELEAEKEENILFSKGKDILRNIDKINFNIKDLEVHTTVNNIKNLSYKILEALKDENEKQNELNSFVIHYLTAFESISEKYLAISDTGTLSPSGEKFVVAYKENIQEFQRGFENLLDNLYKDDMEEAKVEMQVLKSELSTKGLLDSNDFDL